MPAPSLCRLMRPVRLGILAVVLALATSLSTANAVQTQPDFRELLEQRLRKPDPVVPDRNPTKTGEEPGSENPETIVPLPPTPIKAKKAADASTEKVQRMLDQLNQAADTNAPRNSIEFFEAQAISNHPRIRSLLHEIDALRAESLQQSLRPNPRLTLFADEIFNEGTAGLLGASVTTTHVPQRQLQTRSQVKCQEAELVAARIATVRQQIATDVRSAFYNVLIAQRQNELATQLTDSYMTAIRQVELKVNAGEATQAQVLQLEVQFQQASARRADANALYYSSWRQLAAVVGDETMTEQVVQGSLDAITDPLDFNETLAKLVQFSPEINVVNSNIQKAKAILDREIAASLPVTQTQWTVGRDSTTNDFYTGVQYSMPLQKHNRNQGNIAAAQSRLSAAYQQAELLPRRLASRLAQEFQSYDSASNRAKIYLNEILPKSRQAVQMVGQAFEGGEADFLQLLTAQRTLINATSDYLNALKNVWASRQRIQGLLLSDSLGNN